MANDEKTLITTALREIRSLKSQLSEMQSTISLLTASRYRRVSITNYAKENGISNAGVRKQIQRGVLNAERIGNMYYIIQPI